MNDLIFNDLSREPPATDRAEVFRRVVLFLKTFQEATKFGFNKIRFDWSLDQIEMCSGYTLNDFCNEPSNRTHGILLRGLVRYPFVDDDTKEELCFIENSFFIKKNGVPIEVYGLAVAYLYSTLAIAFKSEPFWHDFEYELIIRNQFSETTSTVGCISEPGHTGCHSFQEWFDSRNDVCLIRTEIPFDEKHISLRDDHGKDVLEEFAHRIVRNDYVKV